MNHKGYVGPVGRWNPVRQNYTEFLSSIGLKSHDRLVDMGCGTLRNGIPLITYLDRGNYHGVEANRKALLAGIAAELTPEIILDKAPTFSVSSEFDLPDGKIDWVVAYAVFVHCGHIQLRQFLELCRKKAVTNVVVDVSMGKDLESPVGMRYGGASHGTVRFSTKTIEGIVASSGGRIELTGHLACDTADRVQHLIRFGARK